MGVSLIKIYCLLCNRKNKIPMHCCPKRNYKLEFPFSQTVFNKCWPPSLYVTNIFFSIKKRRKKEVFFS